VGVDTPIGPAFVADCPAYGVASVATGVV